MFVFLSIWTPTRLRLSSILKIMRQHMNLYIIKATLSRRRLQQLVSLSNTVEEMLGQMIATTSAITWTTSQPRQWRSQVGCLPNWENNTPTTNNLYNYGSRQFPFMSLEMGGALHMKVLWIKAIICKQKHKIHLLRKEIRDKEVRLTIGQNKE